MKTLIFDLDGTLIDSSAIVVPVLQDTIRRFSGQKTPSAQTVKDTFGLPDQEIWRRMLPNASSAERGQALKRSEEAIEQRMRVSNLLLPHAREVLEELKRRGHRLTIASNCGQSYLDSVLDSQGLRDYFDHPLCLESVRGKSKADTLAVHIARFGKDGAVMIGDRASDIRAAAAHGIDSVGCAFGFGDDEELQGATWIIHSLPEVLDLFP
jgi:phosphoglycolate phosphatase